MSNGFLSQEEIDSLLRGDASIEESSATEAPVENEMPAKETLTEIEMDLLGEIGNISMGSASTALSTIINQQVNITTPVVSVTTLRTLKTTFVVPNIALEVQYTSGIFGENLLVMKITDAAVIAQLMMGGDGRTNLPETLSEIEISAVSEAMNQMIGSAATSMATMFAREVNIAPPISAVWDSNDSILSEQIKEDEQVVEVAFRLTIGDLVDSKIMQILPMVTAKKIVSIMMGTEDEVPVKEIDRKVPEVSNHIETQPSYSAPETVYYEPTPNYVEQPQVVQQVPVSKASFQPLSAGNVVSTTKNIDLILDVPLEISVVLGKTKKSIKEILSFGAGSLIELDKLAEEPVEILVNGKRVALGEVVVVDENFGVRITNIVSSAERVKSLSQ